MKYLAFILILLLSLTLVSASDCSDYCSDNNYDSGICRAPDEDRETFCEEDESLVGGFDLCTVSLSRCCCSGEDTVLIDEQEEPEETTDTEEECNYLIDTNAFHIDKQDLPQLIFFELLAVILILLLILAFRTKKPQFEED